MRVARTLADLGGSEAVARIHIAEAVSYRRIVPGRSAVLMEGPVTFLAVSALGCRLISRIRR